MFHELTHKQYTDFSKRGTEVGRLLYDLGLFKERDTAQIAVDYSQDPFEQPEETKQQKPKEDKAATQELTNGYCIVS